MAPEKRKLTLAQALQGEMTRQRISKNELARRLAAQSAISYETARRTVYRLLSGDQAALTVETATRVEKALGAVGFFRGFLLEEQPRGTRAALSVQVERYRMEQERQRAEINELRQRVERLERAS